MITFTVPSIVGKTITTNNALGIHFYFEAERLIDGVVALGQQSGTFDIAQVQLEEGSVATPFEHRPYGLELALCRRYFERRRLTVVAPTTSLNYGGSVPVNIEGTFRVSPSFSVNSVLASSNWVGSLVCSVGTFGAIVYSSVQQTTAGAYIDAICDFSAEL